MSNPASIELPMISEIIERVSSGPEPDRQELDRVIVFAERVLPSTCHYIPAQVNQLHHFAPIYAGLVPSNRNLELDQVPILMRTDRSPVSRVSRELYRWTGKGAGTKFHAHLRRVEASLIHAHFGEGGPPALFLSKRLNLPLILHLHGGAELMTDANLCSKWYQWPFLAHRRSLWKRTSAFLCVSEYVRGRALKAGFPPDKTHVHFNGLDCKTFTPRLPITEKDPNLVLYVGRLIPYKGCDYLIRAMQIVQRDRPGSRLVVIGDGSSRRGLQELAQSLGINCTFLGELKPAEVRSWLERARVFCAASVTTQDGQSEAFGVVFLEAQAMGVPVVSFRHGGIPETMREGVTGLLVEERDVNGLAGQILTYLGDDQFWSKSREEGMRWVRSNFDNSVQTAKLEEIYGRAITTFRAEKFEQSMQSA
jgi:colanic acid/amylovoran biosynthesis glycosyltransferase